MARIAFTKDRVGKLRLEPGENERIDWDTNVPGFGVRVRANGADVWVAQYRINGKSRRKTLGRVAVIDIEKARRAAKDVLAKAKLGTDPQEEKRAARARAALTIGSLKDRFLTTKQHTLKPRSFTETTRYIEVAWKPLHDMPLADINRATIAARLGELSEGARVAADRARVALSTFFAWAIGEGLCETNPVMGVNRPSPHVSRKHTLSDDEIREIWNACRGDDYSAIIRMLILTGQRLGEVAGLAPGEVDFEKAVWSLPSQRTKNGRPHDVPLSPDALSILKEHPILEGRNFYFGLGKRPFAGYSKAKKALDKRISANRKKKAKGDKGRALRSMPAWRVHDIRRTVATRMGDIGIQPHVVEAILNHVSGSKAGVAGVYNKSVYANEKRQALTLWAEHVRSVISREPSNVVPLRRA